MKFEKRFLLQLEQDISDADVTSVDPTITGGREGDKEAMAGTLQKGVSPDDYDVPTPPANLSAETKAAEIQDLKQWISEIDNFIELLNSPTVGSIQTKLHSAGCDTLFADIARSEKKKIARLAAELSSLSESLKGYLISSNS